MSLTDEERLAIVDLKISRALKAYDEMLINFNLGLLSTAANRLYYSLFYVCSALLVQNGHEAHSHNGVLSLINLYFVKPGILPMEYGRILRNIFRLRQDSDYDDYFDVKKEDIEQYLPKAQEFITIVKGLISK